LKLLPFSMPARRRRRTETKEWAPPNWGFYVVVQTDQFGIQVHLRPAKRKALTVGSSSGLSEQNDRNAKSGEYSA
jgi:hypothetical protein